jgi:alkanesulfonate monooxygenase SsuD/methylene tetrahydromethanopterin reductase-like flavin-dependent oxidoreductase (luciferase family)
VELGLINLTELTPDPVSGETPTARQRLREIVDAARLADAAGLDVIAVGEHHRPDYAVPSPAVALAAVAAVTEHVRLTSATTLLGTLDPVRVYEDFATLDLLSDGRAEIIAGRGAFTESFALFGHDPAHYDSLFLEHLELLREIAAAPRLSWSGRHRPPLVDAEIAPRALQSPLPIWVGVGGNPQSAARAGTLGLPMNLALIGGDAAGAASTIRTYREAAARAGHDPATLPVATTSHMHVTRDPHGLDTFHRHYAQYLGYHSGGRLQVDRAAFDRLTGPHGVLLAGSPAQVLDKILTQHELFGHDRVLAQVDLGSVPFSQVATSIELLATEVLPALHALGAPSPRPVPASTPAS